MLINKIVIWGHQLHDHTHSYIHNGFFRGFNYLGYKTYWFPDLEENISKLDFNNSLFIVHGLMSKYLPINENSFYVIHNTEMKTSNEKTIFFNSINQTAIPVKNIVNLQVYTKDCINRDKKDPNNKYHYYLEPPSQIIYFPWATDLLPEEIDENIINLDNTKNLDNNKINSNPEVNFIGMILECWLPVREYCIKNNIKFNHYGGTFDINSPNNKSTLENQELIQKSIVAPTIVGEWQKNINYIPCRIFKNISYGKMGLTNSKAIAELFDNKILYSDNITELLDKGMEFEKNPNKNEIVKELMEEVRDKHTYVNRCNYILDYLKKYFNIQIEK